MISLQKETLALLEDIENRIDPETEEDFRNQWRGFLYGEFKGDLFHPERKKLSPPKYEPPFVPINDALSSVELMLRAQLSSVSVALNTPHRNLCMRANYGTGIMTSLFGAEIFVMPYATNTLPTTRPINDTEWIRRMVDKGEPNLMGGFGSDVFAFGELCAEVFEKYPRIRSYVSVYHPDLQGALDICEMLWGAEMFYAMYDEPELVHSALQLSADTFTSFMHKWHRIFPRNDEMNVHWEFLCHRGSILIRDDSAMNLTPEFYKEYAAPYDALLLERFGGGAVHFCGRGDHYIETMSEIPYLYGINLSQPSYNDMEKIYRNTVDKGIPIFNLSARQAKADIGREGGFHHLVSI